MSTVSFKVAQVDLFWRLMITRFITFLVRKSNLVMNLISATMPYKEVQPVHYEIIVMAFLTKSVLNIFQL